MSVSRIWKEHLIARGPKKGQRELFIVDPRLRDGMYCVKPSGERSNVDGVELEVPQVAVVLKAFGTAGQGL